MRGRFAIITHKRETAANSPLIRPCGATSSLGESFEVNNLPRILTDTREIVYILLF